MVLQLEDKTAMPEGEISEDAIIASIEANEAKFRLAKGIAEIADNKANRVKRKKIYKERIDRVKNFFNGYLEKTYSHLTAAKKTTLREVDYVKIGFTHVLKETSLHINSSRKAVSNGYDIVEDAFSNTVRNMYQGMSPTNIRRITDEYILKNDRLDCIIYPSKRTLNTAIAVSVVGLGALAYVNREQINESYNSLSQRSKENISVTQTKKSTPNYTLAGEEKKIIAVQRKEEAKVSATSGFNIPAMNIEDVIKKHMKFGVKEKQDTIVDKEIAQMLNPSSIFIPQKSSGNYKSHNAEASYAGTDVINAEDLNFLKQFVSSPENWTPLLTNLKSSGSKDESTDYTSSINVSSSTFGLTGQKVISDIAKQKSSPSVPAANVVVDRLNANSAASEKANAVVKDNKTIDSVLEKQQSTQPKESISPEYKIKHGDSMIKIASRYIDPAKDKEKMKEFYKVNGKEPFSSKYANPDNSPKFINKKINPNYIQIGKTLDLSPLLEGYLSKGKPSITITDLESKQKDKIADISYINANIPRDNNAYMTGNLKNDGLLVFSNDYIIREGKLLEQRLLNPSETANATQQKSYQEKLNDYPSRFAESFYTNISVKFNHNNKQYDIQPMNFGNLDSILNLR